MKLLCWPFVALWRVVTFFLELTGRCLGIVLGLVLLVVGIVATATIIGAIVGLPLMALGFLILVRSLF